MKTIFMIIILFIITGCDSPWQGNGALYISERGYIKCINVDSVTFVGTRYTVYKVDGASHSTEAALDFYQGQKCR